jgi:hypothetical protein
MGGFTGGSQWVIIADAYIHMLSDSEPYKLDYSRIHQTYNYAIHPAGSGWFTVRTRVFVIAFILSVAAYWLYQIQWLIIPMLYFCSQAVKRRGIREGYVLGYEGGYEAGLRKALDRPDPVLEQQLRTHTRL